MKAIMKYESPLVAPPRDYGGDFFQDVAVALVGVGLIVNSETSPGLLSLDKVLFCPVSANPSPTTFVFIKYSKKKKHKN